MQIDIAKLTDRELSTVIERCKSWVENTHEPDAMIVMVLNQRIIQVRLELKRREKAAMAGG